MRKNYLFLLLSIFIFTFCSENEESLTPPTAEFQFNQGSNYAPATLTFSNQSTNAEYYIWDFGDGSTTTEESPSHIFEKAGNYAVTLTSINKDGSSQFTETINVLQPTAYQIKNISSIPLYSVYSFYDNGVSMQDLFEHETININSYSDEITTSRDKIYVGFYFDGWWLSTNPFTVYNNNLNIFEIYFTTKVIKLGSSESPENINLNDISNYQEIEIGDIPNYY